MGVAEHGSVHLRIHHITLEKIAPNPHQPRKTFDEAALHELAESIKQVGVIQPVVVRPVGRATPDQSAVEPTAVGHGPTYELISGERRWRAAKLAGLTTLPALVRDDADVMVLQVSLIENVQRTDLNAVERAKAYALFRDTFGLSIDDLAVKTGENRSTVANYLRLLELPVPVLDLVQQDQLSMSHARALLALPSNESRMQWAEVAVRKGLSVRELEDIVAGRRGGAMQIAPPPKPKSPTAIQLEEQISSVLGMKVRVKLGTKKGHGALTIKFANLEDFDRIMRLLNIQTE